MSVQGAHRPYGEDQYETIVTTGTARGYERLEMSRKWLHLRRVEESFLLWLTVYRAYNSASKEYTAQKELSRKNILEL